MVSLINPKCAIPLFAMDDENLATECGMWGGLIGASVISALAIVIWSIALVVSKRSVMSMFTLNFAIFTGLLFWLLPLFFSWVSHREWLGYAEQIKAFQNKGQTNKESMQNVQALYQTDLQASAISSIGVGLASLRGVRS